MAGGVEETLIVFKLSADDQIPEGESMIATFDPYNTQLSPSNSPDTGSTLSLVDMTYVKTVSDKLDDLFRKYERTFLTETMEVHLEK